MLYGEETSTYECSQDTERTAGFRRKAEQSLQQALKLAAKENAEKCFEKFERKKKEYN